MIGCLRAAHNEFKVRIPHLGLFSIASENNRFLLCPRSVRHWAFSTIVGLTKEIDHGLGLFVQRYCGFSLPIVTAKINNQDSSSKNTSNERKTREMNACQIFLFAVIVLSRFFQKAFLLFY